MRVRLRRLESIYKKHIICFEYVQRRAARFVCNDYCRSSSVNTMLSNLGWQDLETRRKINDLTMFFTITTGNVRISFSNDLREVHCPYLTRGSLQHPFQYQRYSSTINAHRYSFFVRTVSAWNALSPVSVRADSVAVFHSRICNSFIVFFCSIELGQARCKRIFQGSLTLLASFDFSTSCPKLKVWCMHSNGILFL